MAAALFFKHRRLLLSLPRQEGKTELGIRLLHDITKRPYTSASLFLAKDKRSGKKATREKFMRLFSKDRFEVNTEQVYLKKCPTSAIFMDSVDKDPDRIRGGTYHMIHWSEVAFSKIEKGETIISVYDKIINPTMRQTKGYVLLESTNNGKNGWYDLWENHRDFGFERFKVSLSQMLDMGLVSLAEYEEIRATTHPDVFRQEYECEWVSFLGRVYEEFEESIHVDETMEGPEDWQKVISAIDWGYHPSATCVLFGYVKGGVVHVFDEIYEHKQLIGEAEKSIGARLDLWRSHHHASVADHEEDRIEELNRRGIVCGKANKTNVLGNRLEIKELLWAKKLKIHPRCKNLIRDLQAAVWHDKKEGDLDYTACTWGHFDAEAALRYLIRELKGFEVEEPEANPHKALDEASARAWNMQRAHDDY